MEITKEDLEHQLARVEGYIKNCEWDLQGMFKNNDAVLNKLIKLREHKVDIEAQLEEY